MSVTKISDAKDDLEEIENRRIMEAMLSFSLRLFLLGETSA